MAAATFLSRRTAAADPPDGIVTPVAVNPRNGTTVTYTVTFQGIASSPTGLHIHAPAGSTVTREVPDGALALSRVPQENKEGMADFLRARFRARKAKK